MRMIILCKTYVGLAQGSASASVRNVLGKTRVLTRWRNRMNLRTFTTISAVSMLVLGGCVITTTDGNGGSAGSGGKDTASSSSSSGTAGSGGAAGAGVGGGGGAGGAGACAKTCAEAITNSTPVCDTSMASAELYKALATCSCDQAAADPMPGCKDVCGMNLCTGAAPDADCGKCVQTGNCSMAFGACSADL